MVSCYFKKLEVCPYLNCKFQPFLFHQIVSFFRSLTPENEREQSNKTNIVGDLLQSYPVNEFEIHHNQCSKNGKLWYVYYIKLFKTND